MLIVFNDIKNSKLYNGNTEKFGITFNGIDYIVKLPKDNDLSVYSEYVSSNIIQRLGISCHSVQLGIYNSEVVNIIEDFTGSNIGVSLHSFKDTKQSSEDTEISTKEYTYSDVLYLIDKHLKMSNEAKQEAKVQFWSMFICDAILANRDRHWGNWGYLSEEGNYRVAPLYDNGASLYPGVIEAIEGYKNISTRKQFCKDRVFVFPASLFKVKKEDRSYRTNYYEMFEDVSIYPEFNQQVLWFRRRYSCKDIMRIVISVVNTISLDSIYKRFYIEIVTLRYGCIVLRQDFEKLYDWVEGNIEKLGGIK